MTLPPTSGVKLQRRRATFWAIYHELRGATLAIVLGLLVITLIQLGLFPLILVPVGKWIHFPSLGIQSADWNTARAIWFVEVPLAYLLRRLLSGRLENLEIRTSHTQNFVSSLEFYGIDNIEHLQYHVVIPTRGHSEGQGFVINTSINKRYECDLALDHGLQGLRVPKNEYRSKAELDKYCDEAKPRPIEKIDRLASMLDLKPVKFRPSDSS